MPREGFVRVGALAVGASAMVLAASGLANASVAPVKVAADAACQALEFTRIESGHDHMYVDPTVDQSSCLYVIWDNNAGRAAYSSMSPAGNQGDVYDGPGQNLQVEVLDEANGLTGWGPAN
ncbi:hypothetical protein [Streptomyces griseofuscus]|uniref:hypothetical protein n=1 Tax=Streptomyces griseofuscus TaxID=146922 RepID=UPI0036C8DCAB